MTDYRVDLLRSILTATVAATVAYVFGKIVYPYIDVLFTKFNCLLHCTELVEKFSKELEKHVAMEVKVQEQIKDAEKNGDKLLSGVIEWMEKADKEIVTGNKFLEDFKASVEAMKRCCGVVIMWGDWRTLYSYGKQATDKIALLLQHQEAGKTFEIRVSDDTPPPSRLDIYQNKNLHGIHTQISVLVDIITAIDDINIQIIGIYGIGGVGKTTLAMEVAARVKEQFAVVAFTTVSQKVDLEKIQNETEIARKRIAKGEQVLIILDDVWEELDLDELCIPCGINHMNCKLLLTSRSEDVCEIMNAQCKICVSSLPIEEAWILFKRVVGERVETDADLKPVAKEVAEECCGLPLLIKAIGNALKNKDVTSWNTALTRLQKNVAPGIDPTIKKAFSRLKLSYDYLENEEAQWCFLMCSIFPEDGFISLEELAYYGVGLEKFKELDSMEDARNRVQDAVKILKSCGLLLSVDEDNRWVNANEYIRMHDVVRDVALLIGKNTFLVKARKRLTEWLPRNNISESYTGISLMENEICNLPEYEIHFPHLEILLLQYNKLSLLSEEFIRGVKEARVLDMACNEISSLPQSLKLLTRLRMLNLEVNDSLAEISILGELKYLEILNLNETGIKEIPQEFDQLVNLRRLEVMGCRHLSHIAQGVIKKLWRLEELRIGLAWVQKRVYHCLVEVMSLCKLTYLDLHVRNFRIIPEGLNSEKLKRFLIQIGGESWIVSEAYSGLSLDNYLVICNVHLPIPFLKSIKKLMEVSPSIILDGIENLKNILPNLNDEGFNNSKFIQLRGCPNVSCLVDTNDRDQRETDEKYLMQLKRLSLDSLDNLEVLWNCPDQYISLTNLVEFEIVCCDELVRLFPVSVAQGLVKLKDLKIEFCVGLEEVIWGESDMVEHATNIIVFPCLTRIRFHFLVGLKCFCSANCAIKYPSLVDVNVQECFKLKKWGTGTHETPKLKFVPPVPLDGPYAINDAVAKCAEA